MKIAFCFPGQGSQTVGMGRAIADEFPAARAVYDEASEAVGFDVAKLCFEGSLEELTRTELQQPALVATSIACLRAVETLGISPDYVIGHSVGEYSALAAAGSIQRRRRSRARPRARRGDGRGRARPARRDGCGAGARGLGRRGALRAGSRACGPRTTTAPARSSSRARTRRSTGSSRRPRRRGARKTVKLRVSGGFHSPLVASAAERLQACAREGRRGTTRRTPFMSTVTARARGRAAASPACSSSS